VDRDETISNGESVFRQPTEYSFHPAFFRHRLGEEEGGYVGSDHALVCLAWGI
jgi:hypothetical protein